MSYLFWFDLLGTIVFAISGVLLAAKKEMDPIGALVLAVITAIGGGTIRDMVLNHGPIFWITDSTDLYVAIIASLITMLLLRYSSTLTIPKWLFSVLDAIGLAVFVGIGVNKAIDSQVNSLIAVCMGVMTGVGGGIIRDVLARDIPMVFRTDIYATACIIGGTTHVIAYNALNLPLEISTLLGISVTLIIRLLAIYRNLTLPIVGLKK
ncbi:MULTISPECIES: TRIC cation channel family protein [unclassified Gilliamella]|uniref:TRIC cation channel family protein n=1 Tax=unclassified Gilliamella TaxID=2685620 RepID=UPI00226996D9|nr:MULTISPECIES: TRIC cation channel family protein [unclassified Gilliamella]MCX8642492.1 TRIC cation channel family protein [Gilliamella sp. B3835]MCX8706342.1 TRIC cation channel family protein [Gilliamella sp. B3783]MCX8709758.1 TRIC cation channel family protein [Gilliamella sp. B3780]MCX8714393.1 TRIC cation channel family protein [Gilliamella sp. B3781]MCX8717074.1 TRIC cation channel family protein [Gilliamella sp. B3784]